MKGVWKYIWIVIFLSSLISTAWLSGCKAKPVVLEQDIVFDKGAFGGTVRFGLVNADGSNLEYIEFRQPSDQWAKFPVWSPDKTKLVYLMTTNVIGGSGDLLWMDIGQAKVKDICSSSDAKAWRIDDRPHWTPDGKWWLAVVFDRGVGLISPESCEVERVLVPRPEDGYLRSPDLSVLNELVYDKVLWAEARPGYGHAALGHIMVQDLGTGETRELGRGTFPSWSPDGEWIAFTKEDGLYLMRRDGSEERRLLEIDPWWNAEHATLEPLRASWSSDGHWIVYNKRVYRDETYHQDIYKLNIDTRKEVKLAENGLNPH